MTEPTEFGLLELATPYALACGGRGGGAPTSIARVAAAPTPVAGRVSTTRFRAVCETMAVVSAATAATTARPSAGPLYWPRLCRTLAASHVGAQPFWLPGGGHRHRAGGFSASGVTARPGTPTQTVAEQVLSAPDMQTVSRPLGPGTGDGDVLRAPPQCGCAGDEQCGHRPSPGTVYQMWLIGGQWPEVRRETMGRRGGAADDDGDDKQGSTPAGHWLSPSSRAQDRHKPTSPILSELPLK